jgi:hypothetical protein
MSDPGTPDPDTSGSDTSTDGATDADLVGPGL